MTNTTKFREKVDSRGLKFSFMAESIGISREWLYKKMNNESSFRANEIMIITKLLGLTRRERDDIFFANACEFNSHNKE